MPEKLGGVRSLAKPVSKANNREFFENLSPKQASDGFMATDPRNSIMISVG